MLFLVVELIWLLMIKPIFATTLSSLRLLIRITLFISNHIAIINFFSRVICFDVRCLVRFYQTGKYRRILLWKNFFSILVTAALNDCFYSLVQILLYNTQFILILLINLKNVHASFFPKMKFTLVFTILVTLITI